MTRPFCYFGKKVIEHDTLPVLPWRPKPPTVDVAYVENPGTYMIKGYPITVDHADVYVEFRVGDTFLIRNGQRFRAMHERA